MDVGVGVQAKGLDLAADDALDIVHKRWGGSELMDSREVFAACNTPCTVATTKVFLAQARMQRRATDKPSSSCCC